jgi:hypothetical protein
MIFHGAVVIALGLAAGFPYAFVITGDLPGSERAWRMAHLEGVVNGLLLLAVAGVWNSLVLGARAQAVVAWALVVTAWGNLVASTLGAVFGVRGLTPGGPASNRLVYVLFMAAVVTVLVAVALVITGARERGGRPSGGRR